MDAPELPDPILFAIPAFVALIVAEMIYARMTGRAKFEPRDSAASLVMGLGNTVSGILLGVVALTWFVFVSQYALLDIGWAWWAFALCFVLDDFVYYWAHRFAHTVRWWWADHVVHHSSQHYNLTTALRQPWLSPLTLKFIFFGSWLVLIGFPVAMVAFVGALNLVYQFWIHTETVRRNTSSTPRPITGSITRSIRAISTAIMPACSSSGTGCSARSSPNAMTNPAAMALCASWARIIR